MTSLTLTPSVLTPRSRLCSEHMIIHLCKRAKHPNGGGGRACTCNSALSQMTCVRKTLLLPLTGCMFVLHNKPQCSEKHGCTCSTYNHTHARGRSSYIINEPQLPWLRTAIYHTGLDVKMEVTHVHIVVSE